MALRHDWLVIWGLNEGDINELTWKVSNLDNCLPTDYNNLCIKVCAIHTNNNLMQTLPYILGNSNMVFMFEK